MSLQRADGNGLITPEEYVANQARIAQARQTLEEMEQRNRLGLQRYAVEVETQAELVRKKQELEKKVQEGLEAQRLIQELEKVQFTTITSGPSVNGPAYTSARIEEVPHEQQAQYQPRSGQSSRVSASTYQPVPSYPQNHVHQPHHPSQWQNIGNTGPIIANTTTQNQYPSYHAPSIHQGQQTQSLYTSQHVFSTVPTPYHPHAAQQSAPALASQPAHKTSQPAKVTPYQPYSYSKPQLQQATVGQTYQPSNARAVQPSSAKVPAVRNDSRNLTTPVATYTTPRTNPPTQTSTSTTSTSRNAVPSIPNTAQIQHPQVQTKALPRFIDALGVPYLNVNSEEISALRKHLDHWDRSAPPGTRTQLHEMMYLYKDTETPPKTWIYVPWEPGSSKFARTLEIDKFFVALAENAKLVASGLVLIPKSTSSPNPPSAQPSAMATPIVQSGTNLINVPTTHPAAKASSSGQNLAQVINAQSQHYAASASASSPSAGLNQTSVASSSRAPIGSHVTNYGSTASSLSTRVPVGVHPSGSNSTPNPAVGQTAKAPSVNVAAPKANPPPAVPVPKSPPVTVPSGLTPKLPLPSEVDRRHLTKHILFALGKRSRTSFGTGSPEQPAKRQATEAISTPQPGVGASTTPSSNVAGKAVIPENTVIQAPAPASSVSTSMDTSPALPPTLSSTSNSAASQLTASAVPKASTPNPSVNPQINSNNRPPEKSTTSSQAISISTALSTPIAPTPTVSTIEAVQRQQIQHTQQSMPSIAAARPDLIFQPSAIPATTIQSKTRTPLAPSDSNSRLSVPPIETLKFDRSAVTSPTGSASMSATPTIAAAPKISMPAPTTSSSKTSAPSGSMPPPVAKNVNTISAPGNAVAAPAKNVSAQTAASDFLSVLPKPSNTMTPSQNVVSSSISAGEEATASFTTLNMTPGANLQPYSTQSTFRVSKQLPITSNSESAGPSSLSYNPYTWLLSNQAPSTSNAVPPSGSFSYNQISQQTTQKLQTQPLFLPSPSPSVGPSSRPSISVEPQSEKSRGKTREIMDYVLLPKASYPVQKYLRLEENGGMSETEVTRNRLKRLRTYSSSVSTSVVGDEVLDSGPVADHWRDSSLMDSTEGEALRLSYSRLQQLPCRWDGCDVILNSVNKLVEHLRQHKPKPSAQNLYFTCRWTQCGRRCTVKDVHTENHALQPLRCAYEGCDDSFRTPSQLMKHFNAKHTQGTLKPSAELSKPDLLDSPPVPGIVPAYVFVTEVAKPATISPERHQVLCRLVVQNIVQSDQEKPIRRPRKTARPVNSHILEVGHGYEFIKGRSTRYSSYLSQAVDLRLDDLDSQSVTKMIDEGLMLWSPEGEDGTDVVADDTDIQARASVIQPPSGDIKAETDAAPRATEATDLDGQHQRQEHSSDEDAVEVMLTEVTT